MTTYTAVMNVSGIYLSEGVKLRLTGGVLAANPEAQPWWDSPEQHPAYVVPEGQTGPSLRKIARWLLVCPIDQPDPLLAQAQDYVEKVALPLRLGTPATVTLGGLRLLEETVDEFITPGSQQRPPVTYGVNRFVRLNERECQVMERTLPQLTYEPVYGVSMVHFISASYDPPPEASLKYILSMEAMFDPNGNERGQNQRVSERASTFAGTSVEQKREMKRIVLKAYTHRRALRHGEIRQERLQAANEWLSENELNLRTIASWATQRALRLRLEKPDFDPASYISAVPNADRRNIVKKFMEVPLFWATRSREIMVLSPMMFRPSGASVEMLAISTSGTD